MATIGEMIQMLQAYPPTMLVVEALKGTQDMATLNVLKRNKMDDTTPKSELWSFLTKIDPEAYESFTIQRRLQWVPDIDTNFKEDRAKFMKLTEQQKQPLLKVLAIFQTLDGGVIESFDKYMLAKARTVAESLPYITKIYAEAIHSLSYRRQLEAILPDEEERIQLVRAIDEEEWLKNYQEFIAKYMDDLEEPSDIQPYYVWMARKCFVQALLEGVGFSAFFAVIFWYKTQAYDNVEEIPGIIFSNKKIAEEEGVHRDWALVMFKRYRALAQEDRLIEKMTCDLIRELVSVMDASLSSIIPDDLIGLTKKELGDYIRYTADTLLDDADYPYLYEVENPLNYMDTIGEVSHTNHFETKSASYQLAL